MTVSSLLFERWFTLALWQAAIVSFSSDSFSGQSTASIIVPVLRFLFPEMSPSEIRMWHAVIRKFGHVFEFFVLGILAHRAFELSESDEVRVKMLAGAFVLAAASFDEFRQIWTTFRGPSIYDVGYDCLGGLGGLWAVTLIERTRWLAPISTFPSASSAATTARLPSP